MVIEKEDLKLFEKIRKGAIISGEEEKRLERYRWLGIIKAGMTEITSHEKTAAVNFHRLCKKMPFSEKIKTIFMGTKSACFWLAEFRFGNEPTQQEWVDAVNFHREFKESSFFRRTRMVLTNK